MEIQVTVELGSKTIALLSSLGFAPSLKSSAVATTDAPAENVVTTTKVKVAETTTKTKTAKAPDFGELDADAQLEAIKAKVTQNTKKGKSADVKTLLAFFDAGRASELTEEQYQDFFDMITRYGAGESADDIIESLG